MSTVKDAVKAVLAGEPHTFKQHMTNLVDAQMTKTYIDPAEKAFRRQFFKQGRMDATKWTDGENGAEPDNPKSASNPYENRFKQALDMLNGMDGGDGE